jgi:hypothetical protein
MARKLTYVTNLEKRLKRLENQMNPSQGPTKTWQIIVVDSDGSREEGPQIHWPAASQAGEHHG